MKSVKHRLYPARRAVPADVKWIDSSRRSRKKHFVVLQ